MALSSINGSLPSPTATLLAPGWRDSKACRLLGALAIALTAGCDGSAADSASVVDREGEPYVVRVGPDDRALNDAITAARSSVDDFISELPRLRAGGAYVSVKAPVPAGNEIEHIWLADLEYREGTFYGTLGNEPLSAAVAFGDPYSISADEISDWMALRGDQLYGGYTIFAARNALDEAQRARFDESIGFRVPERPQTF
jgi:uncharacterized protein YegJ (DUF2314 family)